MSAEKSALELYHPMQADVAIHRPPAKVLEEARSAATALTDVISKKSKPVKFNGEIYLEFEDWQTVGRFYGITAKVRDTKFVQFDKASGFEASAEAILVSTGQAISAADAMCLNDEPNWRSKPMFQLRSMAQTRACAKSLRNVLAWVVVLAGYKPTPAEEMDGVIHNTTATTPEPEGGPIAGPSCPKCNGTMRLVPAGKSKTSGKSYGAFWGCTNRECKGTVRDSEWQATIAAAGKPTYADSEPEPDLSGIPADHNLGD